MRKDREFLFQNEDVERTVFVHKQLVEPGQLSLKGMRNVYMCTGQSAAGSKGRYCSFHLWMWIGLKVWVAGRAV